MNGSKPKVIPLDDTVQFGTSTIYEDMQNRIDELERENDEYKTTLEQLQNDLNDVKARQEIWEEIKEENDKLKETLDKTQPIIERLEKLEAERPTWEEFINQNANDMDETEDKDAFKIYKEKYKK